MMTFKKSDNSLVSLGVGQRVLITKWLDEMEITKYNINSDFTIDVNENIFLYNHNMIKFPEYIRFNIAKGEIYCDGNQLITLTGFPKTVNGFFNCSNNQLSNLEGCPKTVGTNFWCKNNKVQFTEEYIRKVCEVGGNIYV
jgi:hypothetical protein